MTARSIRLVLCLAVFVAGRPSAGVEPVIQFTDATDAAGLRVPLEGMMGHASAWGDIDGDGDLDLYVGGFADRPDDEYRPAPGPVPNRLFRNDARGRFEPVTNASVELFGRSAGAVFADLDNDGMLDLYVANNTRPNSRLPPGVQRDAQLNRSRLFRNDAGTLVDVSETCVAASGSARSAGVLDYDGDGLLDLLIVEDRFSPRPARTRLCRNLGNFKFADVTLDAALPKDLFGFGVAIADLNDDSRPDFFVTHSNRLFVSAANGCCARSRSISSRSKRACTQAIGGMCLSNR